MDNNNVYCYFGGAFKKLNDTSVSLDNLGFDRGFGVFDFMRQQDSVMLFREDHLERFEHSQKFLLDDIAFPRKEVSGILDTLREKNNLVNSTYKLVLSGVMDNDGITPHLAVFNKPYAPFDKNLYTNGATLLLEKYVREYAEIKTTNYLTSFRLFANMKKTGSVDVLYYKDDKVSEASRSNIFIVLDDTVLTPASDVLFGVTRKNVLGNLGKKYNMVVRDFDLDTLLNAREAFLTSTLKKVMPIVKVGDHVIGDGKVGPKTQAIMSDFEDLSRTYIEKHKGHAPAILS